MLRYSYCLPKRNGVGLLIVVLLKSFLMLQITKSEIELEIHRLAELINAQPNQFLTTDNSKEAWPNMVNPSDETIYYEAHEQGEKIFSFLAFDWEHLMFMVFKDISFQMTIEHERRNRSPDKDFQRQLFSKQIELMRTLNAKWAGRTQKEVDAILQTAPFDDRLSAK